MSLLTGLLFCLPFLGVGILIFWLVRVDHRRRAALHEQLRAAGFTPCPDRQRWLNDTLNAIVLKRDVTGKVREPYRRFQGRAEVYAFQVRWRTRRGRGTTNTSGQEVYFLLPLRRPRPDPLHLILVPADADYGHARALAAYAESAGGILGWLLAKAKDFVASAKSDGALTWVDVPEELAALGVLALLAPPDTLLPDLLDPEDMLTLIEARTYGVRDIACLEDLCLLTLPVPNVGADATVDLGRILTYVQAWVARDL